MSTHYVYRVFDADERIIFVGSTPDLNQCVFSPSNTPLWIGQAVKVRATVHPCRADAQLQERTILVSELLTTIRGHSMSTPVKSKEGGSQNGKWELSSPFNSPAEDVRVGSTLRRFRMLRGFTAGQFATALDISNSYLSNIEAGRKRLSNILLARAAETLRIEQIDIMIPRPTTDGKQK